MASRVIERLLAILFTLIERVRPHTVDLGDDMDSLPYIADAPGDVIAETPPNEGTYYSDEPNDPARKGDVDAGALNASNETIETGGAW